LKYPSEEVTDKDNLSILDEGKDKNNSTFEMMSEQKCDSSNRSDYLVTIIDKEGKEVSNHRDNHVTSRAEVVTKEFIDLKQLEENVPIDEILYVKLFFCPSNDVLSENIEIDPILRLAALYFIPL